MAAPAAQPAPLEAPAAPAAPSSKLPMGAPSAGVVNGWMMLDDVGSCWLGGVFGLDCLGHLTTISGRKYGTVGLRVLGLKNLINSWPKKLIILGHGLLNISFLTS